jgi:septum formation protein
MMGVEPPRLILASASPRRADLLRQAGYVFEVRAADADETVLPGEDAIGLALRLARVKACAGTLGRPDEVLLGADTVVQAQDGELLGKPVDDADAARMLALLAGGTHRVVTGVCCRCADRIEIAASVTYVTFTTIGAAEIADYVASGEPHGKAGAYAIQGRAARWASRILGEYTNIVGLPLSLTAAMLEGFGISGLKD